MSANGAGLPRSRLGRELARSRGLSAVLDTPPPRDGIAERRQALQRSVVDLVKAAVPKRSWSGTGVARGQHTELYLEFKAKPVLSPVVKVNVHDQPSVTTLRARRAAVIRWHREGDSSQQEDGSSTAITLRSSVSDAAPHNSRYWKRGESNHFRGTVRAHSVDELAFWVEAFSSKKIKHTEYKELYDEGRVRVPPAAIKERLYASETSADDVLVVGFKSMGAPRQVSVQEPPSPTDPDQPRPIFYLPLPSLHAGAQCLSGALPGQHGRHHARTASPAR